MNFKYLKYEAADGVLVLTLNRPEHLNAQTAESCAELITAFDYADQDDEVKALIVTGAGKAFCAGADLSAAANAGSFLDRFTGKAGKVDHRDEGGMVALRIYDMKKPVIAAINGAAVGFGATLTLPMDIRIASSKAKMGFVFARRGIGLDACATWFLPRLVGMGVASEWVYSGRVFSSQEAYEKGLVTWLVEPEDLITRAKQIALEITDNASSIAVALCRQMMWKMLGADHPMEAHILESKYLNWLYGQPDAHEGVMSFLEKRPPKFPMNVSRDMPSFYPWWNPRKYRQ